MDAQRFDALTRAFAPGSRRGLLGALLAAPVVGTLLAILGAEDTEAKGRRKRRRRRHRHGQGRPKNRRKKTRKGCKRKSRARICRGKCGIVKNRKTCQKKINCGSCGPTCTDLLPTADLQQAIDDTAEGATLDLCAGTWLLDAPVTITKNLTLRGVGAEQTSLDGQDAVRVLHVMPGADVTLQNLTIANGRADGESSPDVLGGGIFNLGTLVLRGVRVTGNTADGGGGILNNIGGTVTLGEGSVVSGNEATLDGGGIHNSGEVTLKAGSVVGGDTEADANTATRDGGGIVNNFGTLILEDGSRVAGNTAGSVGGGIFNVGGAVEVQDGSRVVGNTATGDGGGIYNVGGTVTVEIGAFVCDNEPPDHQCAGPSPIANCPTPAEECPG